MDRAELEFGAPGAVAGYARSGLTLNFWLAPLRNLPFQ
jgi:hypothetical protein